MIDAAKIAELLAVCKPATDCTIHVVQVANHFMLLDAPEYSARDVCRFDQDDDPWPAEGVESEAQAKANAEKFASAWNNFRPLLEQLQRCIGESDVERLTIDSENYRGKCAACGTACMDMLTDTHCAACEVERLTDRLNIAEAMIADRNQHIERLETALEHMRSLAAENAALRTDAERKQSLVEHLADGKRWNWTTCIGSARDAADRVLRLMVDLGMVEKWTHPLGGDVWKCGDKLYGRTDGLTPPGFTAIDAARKGG